jgi:hypothetical protein
MDLENKLSVTQKEHDDKGEMLENDLGSTNVKIEVDLNKGAKEEGEATFEVKRRPKT